MPALRGIDAYRGAVNKALSSLHFSYFLDSVGALQSAVLRTKIVRRWTNEIIEIARNVCYGPCLAGMYWLTLNFDKYRHPTWTTCHFVAMNCCTDDFPPYHLGGGKICQTLLMEYTLPLWVSG